MVSNFSLVFYLPQFHEHAQAKETETNNSTMRGTTEEEDGVTNFSDVLLLSNDVLGSSNVGEDSFGFGSTGKDIPQMLCFGGGNQNDAELLFSEPSFSPASPISSSNNTCAVDDKCTRSNVSFKKHSYN